MQIGKSRTTKELWRFGKTKNEESRGLRRLINGRNYVPKVLRQIIWRRRPKNDEKLDIWAHERLPCA